MSIRNGKQNMFNMVAQNILVGGDKDNRSQNFVSLQNDNYSKPSNQNYQLNGYENRFIFGQQPQQDKLNRQKLTNKSKKIQELSFDQYINSEQFYNQSTSARLSYDNYSTELQNKIPNLYFDNNSVHNQSLRQKPNNDQINPEQHSNIGKQEKSYAFNIRGRLMNWNDEKTIQKQEEQKQILKEAWLQQIYQKQQEKEKQAQIIKLQEEREEQRFQQQQIQLYQQQFQSANQSQEERKFTSHRYQIDKQKYSNQKFEQDVVQQVNRNTPSKIRRTPYKESRQYPANSQYSYPNTNTNRNDQYQNNISYSFSQKPGLYEQTKQFKINASQAIKYSANQVLENQFQKQNPLTLNEASYQYNLRLSHKNPNYPSNPNFILQSNMYNSNINNFNTNNNFPPINEAKSYNFSKAVNNQNVNLYDIQLMNFKDPNYPTLAQKNNSRQHSISVFNNSSLKLKNDYLSIGEDSQNNYPENISQSHYMSIEPNPNSSSSVNYQQPAETAVLKSQEVETPFQLRDNNNNNLPNRKANQYNTQPAESTQAFEQITQNGELLQAQLQLTQLQQQQQAQQQPQQQQISQQPQQQHQQQQQTNQLRQQQLETIHLPEQSAQAGVDSLEKVEQSEAKKEINEQQISNGKSHSNMQSHSLDNNQMSTISYDYSGILQTEPIENNISSNKSSLGNEQELSESQNKILKSIIKNKSEIINKPKFSQNLPVLPNQKENDLQGKQNQQNNNSSLQSIKKLLLKQKKTPHKKKQLINLINNIDQILKNHQKKYEEKQFQENLLIK